MALYKYASYIRQTDAPPFGTICLPQQLPTGREFISVIFVGRRLGLRGTNFYQRQITTNTCLTPPLNGGLFFPPESVAHETLSPC